MQPYFLPYIGYFQLITAVDKFLIYDNIKYTKKGWINRNRLLLNGKDETFTIPLAKTSDSLNIVERNLSVTFNRRKLLNKFRGAYGKAPQFKIIFPLLEQIVNFDDDNLFRFVHHSIKQICSFLGIVTPISNTSAIKINHGLKAQDKVLALCKAMGAEIYINPIGGTKLYDNEAFSNVGLDLKFIKFCPFEYEQLGNAFIPGLSIIDVLMFNPLDRVQNEIFYNFKLV
jgi:hypothetical protein